MTLLAQGLPDTGLTLGVPDGWRRVTPVGVALAAAEDGGGTFAANVTAVVDPASPSPTVSSAVAVLGSVVALVPIDVRALPDPEIGVDLMFCHLVGGTSVTTLQRQLLTGDGVVTVTVTCATADWPRLAGVAEDIVDSLKEAL